MDLVSVRRRIGIGKRLANELFWSDQTASSERMGLSKVLCVLEAPFVVKAVMEGTANCKEDVHKSIGTKVQVGEVQLLDVVQCATVWKALGYIWSVEYDVAMDGRLAMFQAEASGTRPPSQLEVQVIKLILLQIDVLHEKLAYHWRTSK